MTKTLILTPQHFVDEANDGHWTYGIQIFPHLFSMVHIERWNDTYDVTYEIDDTEETIPLSDLEDSRIGMAIRFKTLYKITYEGE